MLASTTTAKRPPLPPEQQGLVLDEGSLRLTDLGEGWAEQPYGSARSLDIDTISDLGAQEACKKLMTSIIDVKALEKKNSPLFEQPAKLVQNSATYFEDADPAQKLLVQLNRSDPRLCLDKAFEQSFRRQADKVVPDGGQITSVRTQSRSIPPIGDFRSSFEITVDTMKDGALRSFYFTRVAVIVGPVVLDFSFRSEGQPYPQPETVIEPVVKRVDACLAGLPPCGSNPTSSVPS